MVGRSREVRPLKRWNWVIWKNETSPLLSLVCVPHVLGEVIGSMFLIEWSSTFGRVHYWRLHCSSKSVKIVPPPPKKKNSFHVLLVIWCWISVSTGQTRQHIEVVQEPVQLFDLAMRTPLFDSASGLLYTQVLNDRSFNDSRLFSNFVTGTDFIEARDIQRETNTFDQLCDWWVAKCPLVRVIFYVIILI